MPSASCTLPTRAFSDVGSSVIELALIAPLLLLLLLGAVDMGRAFCAGIELSSAAATGATYGTLHPSDTAGMVTAATFEAGQLTPLTAVSSWGCECSDGSSVTPSCTATPSCTTNVVEYVEVDTRWNYVPLFHYPGIPASVPMSSRSRMRTTN